MRRVYALKDIIVGECFYIGYVGAYAVIEVVKINKSDFHIKVLENKGFFDEVIWLEPVVMPTHSDYNRLINHKKLPKHKVQYGKRAFAFMRLSKAEALTYQI
jgi:hypothetical protein